MRGATAALAAALVALLSGSSAEGAGRRPFVGQVVLPVERFAGVGDPHVVATRQGRLLASLVHARLVRPDGDGFVGELARSWRWSGRSLTVTLVDGARCHDGQVVRAADVVTSLRRLGQLGARAPLGGLFAALEVREVAPGRVLVKAPRGATQAEVLALLARPEAAILRGGRPGSGRGCGPFRPASGDSGTRVLEAFTGHAVGRPWLDVVRVERVAGADAAEAAFAFGDVDLSLSDTPRTRRAAARAQRSGVASFIALPHPRLAGESARDLRRAVVALAKGARLPRYVNGRASVAERPWPAGIAPTKARLGRPARQPPRLAALTVAYPAGDEELADLARALRDALRTLATGTARVAPVEGLTAASAREEGDASWDIALLRHEWAATTRAQAAYELAILAGLKPPSARAVLSGQVKPWSDGVVRDAGAMPIVHVERPLLIRRGLEIAPSAAGVPDLAASWRPR